MTTNSARSAILVVVFGWYLVTAPTDQRGYVDRKRPIKEWIVISAFDKAAECEARRGEMTADTLKKFGRHNPKTGQQDYSGQDVFSFDEVMRMVLCVPTDKML